MNNQFYLLALNRISSLQPKTIVKILQHWPNLEELFQQTSKELQAFGLTPKVAYAIKNFNFDVLEQDKKWQSLSPHHHILSIEDAQYPHLLKEITDPPAILYVIGDTACLQQTTIAMVGSRKPSIAGSETAFLFANKLAQFPITIVSGLAAGIDRQAHEGCLKAGGKTVAVMGTGIDRIYPAYHEDLASKIAQFGLLMSEFPLGTPPHAGHFPRRNRIISGLSLAILVVEAAKRSGSLITARFALEQNREVMAIPGSIYNLQSNGCHYLLQQGATLITTPQDILCELSISHKPAREKMPHPGETNQNSHGNEYENLVKCVGFEITTIDQIMHRTHLSIETITCELANLELQGIVKAVPGGYMRCP